MDTLEYSDILCENKGHMVNATNYLYHFFLLFFNFFQNQWKFPSFSLIQYLFSFERIDIGPYQIDGTKYQLQK